MLSELLPFVVLLALILIALGGLLPLRVGLAGAGAAAIMGAALLFFGERAMTVEWSAAHPSEDMHPYSLYGIVLLGVGALAGPALLVGKRMVPHARRGQVAALVVSLGALTALLVGLV